MARKFLLNLTVWFILVISLTLAVNFFLYQFLGHSASPSNPDSGIYFNRNAIKQVLGETFQPVNTPTPAPTPTPTPTVVLSCFLTCVDTTQCQLGLECLKIGSQERCVKKECPIEESCNCQENATQSAEIRDQVLKNTEAEYLKREQVTPAP